ncbi:MAG: hypothetical protein RLZZ04_2798 [Cyanobacteriota bacterium]|jgi:hypothetical protein
MGININDLNQSPLGGELLSGSESIMGNLRVLSEEELKVSGGGKGKGKGGGNNNNIIIIGYPGGGCGCGSRHY